MKLNEKIIDVSIGLFNEQGSHRITTNHIIDEMKISPGTLYYHFKNKEEIIRKIFDRIIADFDALFADPGKMTTTAGFFALISSVYELLYRYRFFYTDMAMLLERDPLLRETYMKNMEKRYAQQEALYRLLVSSGVMKEIGEGELRPVFDNLWMVSDFWFSFLHATRGKVSAEDISGGVLHYFAFLGPYLTSRARKEIGLLR